MKTDQDLIFEAYAKTLNEGSHPYGDTELGPGKYKAKDVTITDYDIEGLTRDGVGGGYNMVPVEFEDDNGTTMTGIVDYLYVDYDQVDGSGMIHDAKVGTLEEDDNDQYAPEEAPADDQALDIAPEEDYEDAAFGKLDDDLMPVKNKSGFENFYAEGESFADKLSDEGLEFAIKNLNQLKGILMDEFGYRRQK